MFRILCLSAGAGIIGTGAGGLISLLFGRRSKTTVSYLLSFAGGVMLGIVFFDLAPTSLQLSGVFVTAMSIVIGVVCVWMLNYAIDWGAARQKPVRPAQAELRRKDQIVAANHKKSMMKSGMMMFAAIALHNLPEGMAIGSGNSHSPEMGFVLATLIALHNIPEGISIAAPLIEGGMSRPKAVGMTALSGAPTFAGGIIGALLGGISESVIGMSMGFAAGAMLYVTFCEILPQATMLDRSKKPAFFSVAGVIFALMIVSMLE